jgi:hypothetical protein
MVEALKPRRLVHPTSILFMIQAIWVHPYVDIPLYGVGFLKLGVVAETK